MKKFIKLLGLLTAIITFATGLTVTTSPQQANAQFSPQNSIVATCTLNATGRICIAQLSPSTTACTVTIQTATVALSGVTATVQVASDNQVTWTSDPYFGNNNITAVGVYSGPVIWAPSSSTPTYIAVNVSAYTSGSAPIVIVCNNNPAAAINYSLSYGTGGAWTASVPTGASNNIVSARPGRIVSVTITTVGTTGNTSCFDNATTNSGTIVAQVNGTTSTSTNTVGVLLVFNKPLAFGLVCTGAASSPVFTVDYF